MPPKKKTFAKKRHLRFVTATTLFDGHDASINIIRRLLQHAGAEVIHLGHHRSAREIVDTAIQEGAHAIAASSYQGGHMEFFAYMKKLLAQNGAPFVKIFGGGGGVITPEEISNLEASGIEKIYSPEDGQKMGLAGIIADMISRTTRVAYTPLPARWQDALEQGDPLVISRLLSCGQGDFTDRARPLRSIQKAVRGMAGAAPVIGITGTGGSGKSTIADEFIRRFLAAFPGNKIAVISIDPTRMKTGGALLGDRMRMNFLEPGRTYMRSFATRGSGARLASAVRFAADVFRAARYDLVIVETPGIGQEDTSVAAYCDFSLYVTAPDFGAPTQLEKIGMFDIADIIVINKFDRRNAPDALRDAVRQYRRDRGPAVAPDSGIPVIGTIASNYSDKGMNNLFERTLAGLRERGLASWRPPSLRSHAYHVSAKSHAAVPPRREHYLSDIAAAVRDYHGATEQAAREFRKLEPLLGEAHETRHAGISAVIKKRGARIGPEFTGLLREWDEAKQQYSRETFTIKHGTSKTLTRLQSVSASGIPVPRIALPDYGSLADTVRWLRGENLPGRFPFTAGAFPFRNEAEEPLRQFAGEGGPERTNRRFHYLSKDSSAKRLSTAFDSLALYGHDPSAEPDIFGKIGESGVSVCTLDDMKALYRGFDLCSRGTSVSMTVNGPAPVMLALFFNAAIDRQAESFYRRHRRRPNAREAAALRRRVFRNIRGTVQADILKEDQGQNSCIFSANFALKMMGDVQEFFIRNGVRHFYSVSISGYHIAEAGAGPVTQLAFTLANAFTYVEYFLSRGMTIDQFAPNLSFFFSAGMNPEYAVLIRVARRIWALAMKYVYGAAPDNQRLKCHIQTSGRSLHAEDIQFNDVRTTLQALTALTDNCNSLHTNSYDEAVTTPTEESVRRAMAIQLIIGRESGMFKNQNPAQGSFFIHRLTAAVEEAVLAEFESLSVRGGVLGAMESHYQRGKIQDESLMYETKKHSGETPIIGVNTFLNPAMADIGLTRPPIPLTRCGDAEKKERLLALRRFHASHRAQAGEALHRLRETALSGGNIFEELMNTTRFASLGQITDVLYDAGGKYRRNT